jgi:hypothetical protein
MNQDKTQAKTRMETRMPEANPAKAQSAPSTGTPPPETPGKIEIDPALLSYSLARDLARVPREEWAKIESIACRVGFTRDVAEGVRFVDAVANVINQQGGLFDTQDPDKRHNLEQCSREIVDAYRGFILTTVQVARKLRLTNILERYWRLLSIYGTPPKKADSPRAAPKPEPANPASGPAEAA